jgi:hypothetical protein
VEMSFCTIVRGSKTFGITHAWRVRFCFFKHKALGPALYIKPTWQTKQSTTYKYRLRPSTHTRTINPYKCHSGYPRKDKEKVDTTLGRRLSWSSGPCPRLKPPKLSQRLVQKHPVPLSDQYPLALHVYRHREHSVSRMCDHFPL